MAPQAVKRLLARLRPERAKRGERGESLACDHLEGSGLEVLHRNWRCRSGEVDVVAREGEVTVFVEVKERSGDSHGQGHEAVTFAKRRRIIRAARLFAAARGLYDRPIRFDVVSVDRDASGRPRIRHDRGAFDSDGR